VTSRETSAGNVSRIGETTNAYEFRRGNLLENFHLEDLKADGRITLRWILWRYEVCS